MNLKATLISDKQKADFIYDCAGLLTEQDAFEEFVPVFGIEEWHRILDSPEYKAREGTSSSALLG